MSVRSYKTERATESERERVRHHRQLRCLRLPFPVLQDSYKPLILLPCLHKFHTSISTKKSPFDWSLTMSAISNFPAAHRHRAAPVGVSEAGKFGFRSAVASVPFQVIFLKTMRFGLAFPVNFIRQLQSIGFWWHWCNFLKTWGQLSLVFDWRGNFWWLLGIDVCWKLLVRRDTWIEALTLKIFTSAAIEFGKQFANRVAFLSLEMLQLLNSHVFWQEML